jgi:LysM repeat protein
MPGQKLTRDAPAGGPGADKSGGKLEGKLASIGKRNPATAIGIGGVLVVVVVAMAKRSKGGAADPSSDQLQQYGAGVYDSTATDLYNSIEGQLEALGNQIGAISKPPAPPVPPKPAPPKGKPKPKPSPHKPKPKPKHHFTYTVHKGNTLGGIAKKYHISLATLKKKNPTLFNSAHHHGNLIKPGEHVKIR